MARRVRPSLRLPRSPRALAALILALLAAVGGGVFLQGKVMAVADGDTLTVFEGPGPGVKVRLYGIDCPESDQPGGREAEAFTRSLALLEDVRLDKRNKDRYGRSVAVVILPDGRVLNEELIKNGHAWVYPAYCKEPRCARWKAMEAKARQEKRGLWNAGKKAVPPWQWRKNRRPNA